MTSPINPALAFLDDHPFIRQSTMDKIHGCIVGSALGDAIGLYTEFFTKTQCRARYPDRQFTLLGQATKPYPDRHRQRFESCAWTDDTDHALLILLSYLHSRTSAAEVHLVEEFPRRLKLWRTQGLRVLNRPPLGIGSLVGHILEQSGYLYDPVGTATAHWVESGRNAAPNGSLMRTHPIGVLGISMSEKETWKLSADISRTTHVDPRCVVSCCIASSVIRGLIRGEITTETHLDAAIERTYTWTLSQPHIMNPATAPGLTATDTAAYLDRADFDHHVYTPSLAALRLDQSGRIGYVYKCLGAAILLLRLCMRRMVGSAGVLRRKTVFEDLVVELVMEGGDADTNAAAAGALLGAFLGYAYLPAQWALGLRHKEWVVGKVERVCVAVGVVEGRLEGRVDEGADGGKGVCKERGGGGGGANDEGEGDLTTGELEMDHKEGVTGGEALTSEQPKQQVNTAPVQTGKEKKGVETKRQNSEVDQKSRGDWSGKEVNKQYRTPAMAQQGKKRKAGAEEQDSVVNEKSRGKRSSSKPLTPNRVGERKSSRLAAKVSR